MADADVQLDMLVFVTHPDDVAEAEKWFSVTGAEAIYADEQMPMGRQKVVSLDALYER